MSFSERTLEEIIAEHIKENNECLYCGELVELGDSYAETLHGKIHEKCLPKYLEMKK